MRDCKLREMVSVSPTPHGPLRVFFSVHRQVARNRTEQIGLGALPVRMLFQKVTDGWMDVPTKVKVPLQNGQGTLKCKVLLRNIPRFHQLPGEDLVNVNGVITPVDVDLSARKIVPWMKLPRTLESKLKKPPAPPPVVAVVVSPHDFPRVSNASSNSDATMLYESAPSSGVGFPPQSVGGGGGMHAPPRSSPRSEIHAVSDPATPPSLSQVAPFGSLDISSGIANLTLNNPASAAVANTRPAGGAAAYALPRPQSGSETGSVEPVQPSKSVQSSGSGGMQEGKAVGIGLRMHSTVSDDALPTSRVSDDGAGEEWIAVEDATSGLFYFANKETHESLWLPPDWECEKDEEGRVIFVDYESGHRQFSFPAEKAREYKASVYSAS